MNVSVIIPTFNRAQVLARALDSILAQNNLDTKITLDIIVVDDGSTDNTAEFIKHAYPQVRYYYQENRGVSAARNLGIENANSEWIALLDSDDEWLPHKLTSQFDTLKRSGLKVCHTEEIWVRNGVRVNQMNKHKKMGGWIFKQCLPLCAMSPSSIIIHRGVFDELGLFDEGLPACEDYDLWLRIANQFEVDYVKEPCIKKYGGHDDQLSRLHWGMDRFRVIALQKFLESSNADLDNIELARTMLLKKLSILHKGALKHSNHELVAECESSLSKYALRSS
jgi:glycosyltransferase involved in cell wall biosynthesis